MSFPDLEQIRALIKVRGRTVWDPASFLPPDLVKDWASVLGGTPQEASLTAVTHMVFPDKSFAALEGVESPFGTPFRRRVEHPSAPELL